MGNFSEVLIFRYCLKLELDVRKPSYLHHVLATDKKPFSADCTTCSIWSRQWKQGLPVWLIDNACSFRIRCHGLHTCVVIFGFVFLHCLKYCRWYYQHSVVFLSAIGIWYEREDFNFLFSFDIMLGDETCRENFLSYVSYFVGVATFCRLYFFYVGHFQQIPVNVKIPYIILTL